MEYKRIDTNAEVYAAIRAAYPQMNVFSSYSAPDGDHYGNPDECKMMTEWGFDQSEIPLIGVETVWEKDAECSYKRVNERHTYWLCIPKSE